MFYLHYDVVQKELLMSLLETSGAVVTGDNEDERVISALLNMEQLAFVKSSGCIERVGSDEGVNPYLSENVGNSASDVDDRQEDAEDGGVIEENDASGIPAELSEELSAAELTAVCPCPGNQNMENAKRISDESNTVGCICCPGSEQWFVFTAARTGRYSILTTGSSDTVGTLYDCCGNQLAEVDDYAPCGKINFRIVCNLTAGATYYVKVRLYGSNTGSYVLRVTDQVFADYVTVSKDSVTLDYGVTYELPITPGYTYRGYNGAKRISGLSVSVSPSYADEKKVWWYAQNSDILSTSTGWDNAGNRYIHITAKKSGTTKLFAEDWNENGKRDECIVCVTNKVMVLSCSPEGWLASSEIMGRDMAEAFDCEDNFIVETPTSLLTFENSWTRAGECVVIHTHGSPTVLCNQVDDTTPTIISKNQIANLTRNSNISFIMMTACSTAGGTENDNVAYWLSKIINPNGIVIANTDTVYGGSEEFGGKSGNPTWKVYRDGVIQNPISDIKLTMQSAYDIYKSYR